jgi:hypothetical protein
MMNNPAALAFLPSKSIEAHFSLLIPKLNFKNSLNDKEGNTKIYQMFDFAYAHSSTDAKWMCRFGIHI